MPGPDVRLIAIDIDGTLLDSRGQVSAANVDALVAAIADGVDQPVPSTIEDPAVLDALRPTLTGGAASP